MRAAATLFLVLLIQFSTQVFAYSVTKYDSGMSHMAVDEKGVKWSHSELPAPGACVSRESYKPTRSLSNGELMSRGYAPLPPQGYGKNRKWRPSRTGSSKSPKPSSYYGYKAQPANVEGNIIVVTETGPIGFIRRSLSQFGTFTYTTNSSEAEVFSKAKNPSPSKDFEITATSQDNPLFGAVHGFSSWPVGNPIPAPVYASFSPVPHSVAPATNTANPTGQPSESNLWNMNASTGELTAQWGLDSGEYVDMKLFHDVTYGDLNMAPDLDAYTSYFGDVIETVQFYFVAL